MTVLSSAREHERLSIEAKPAGLSTAGDLADLMSSFNEVTSRLERTHVQLRSEVARLQNELDEAREQIARSKRMAALGEMAAGIAHEIRNPLGSIGLYARMLLEDLQDGSGEHTTAAKIAGAVRRLNAIVGDVLVFSRGMTPVCERVDGPALLESAVESCASHADIKMEVAQEPMGVECDQTLVHQALVNLIQNGAQAIREAGVENGTIQLSVSHGMELDEHGRRRAVALIRVRDNGPGIEQDVIERMFNPFFTTRESGTGLGLAIVHRIMDAHGGRAVIRNNDDGVGATAELRFPGHAVVGTTSEAQSKEAA
ncbi:MAG: ATP-binding protein [Planctomycetota bacterium]